MIAALDGADDLERSRRGLTRQGDQPHTHAAGGAGYGKCRHGATEYPGRGQKEIEGMFRRLSDRGVGKNVIVLGWVSFFTDLASEMLYPLMPLFLVHTLGAPPSVLGLVDGLAEGISSGLRWISGALSDRFRRRKPFVFAGYTISALSKPIMGLAEYALGWPMFLIGRCSDRLGKSIRTSARDALIADSTAAESRGLAFGLHRAMDTCGAIAGPLVALVLLRHYPQQVPAWIFFAAVVPGLISSLLVVLFVRDLPHEPGKGEIPSIWQSFPKMFWLLILANAIFSLGNSSDSFLILRSSDVGLSTHQVILAFMLYNVVYAAMATPLGSLSDRIGRRPVVVAGWIVYAAVYLGFAMIAHTLGPWILFGIYGLYQALTEGVTKAMVSDVVASHQRAGAIGLFYTVSGFGQLLASLIAGWTWNFKLLEGRLMFPFVFGAACAVLGAVALAAFRAPVPSPTGRGSG
jgi:MFS family permease